MANPWGLTPLDETPDSISPPGTPLAPPPPSNWGVTPQSESLDTGTTAPPVRPDTLLPAEPYNVVDAAMHGASLGLSDVALSGLIAGQRYLTGQTPDYDWRQAATEVKRGREAYAAGSPYTNLGANLAGTLVGPGGLAMDAIKGAGTLGKIAIGGLTGGAIGGVQGAADNPVSLPEAIQGAKTGAEWGGTIGAAIPTASAVGSTFLPELSANARILRAAGVNPTQGSAVGGIPGAVENLLSHIPVAGAPIQGAREQAQKQLQTAITDQADSLNRGAVNQPLARIGAELSPDTATGHDAIAEMQTKISNAFKQAVPTAGGALDAQASTALNDSVANTKLNLPDAQAAQFEKFVQNKVLGKVQGTTLSGPDFQDVDQQLGNEAHAYLKSLDPDQQKLGDAYLNLQGNMRDWLRRVSPQNADALDAANDAWRMARPVQAAAARTNDPNGIFTTTQLTAASRASSTTPQFAAGGALMQKYAADAEMARSTLANAGKSLRAVSGPHGAGVEGAGVMGGVLGAEALAHLMEASPWALGATALSYPAMMAAYSNPVRRMITGLLGAAGQVPPAIAPLGPVGAQLAPGLLNYNRQTQP